MKRNWKKDLTSTSFVSSIKDIDSEEWRDIVGYEGMYQVSNYGRIKSLHKGKILKPQYINGGYLKVGLSKQSKITNKLIHRLVAEAFIPNPNNLPYINHKDENPSNCCDANLEWCDSIYNNNYGHHNRNVSRAVSHPISQYSKNGELIKIFPSMIAASKECGVDHSNLVRAANGKRKTCGGYTWKKVKPLKRKRIC